MTTPERTRAMIEEIQAQQKIESCKAVTVATGLIDIGGAPHGASVSHCCVLPGNHNAEYCQCACGHGWRKIG